MCSYSCELWQHSVRHSWHRQHEHSQWTRNAVIDGSVLPMSPGSGKQISAAPSQSNGEPRLLGVEEFSSGKSLWKSASSCTYWAQKCMCASWRWINDTSSLTQTAGSLCQTQALRLHWKLTPLAMGVKQLGHQEPLVFQHLSQLSPLWHPSNTIFVVSDQYTSQISKCHRVSRQSQKGSGHFCSLLQQDQPHQQRERPGARLMARTLCSQSLLQTNMCIWKRGR